MDQMCKVRPPPSAADQLTRLTRMLCDSHLDEVPGFVEFHLLKGPEAEDHTLYASHTVCGRTGLRLKRGPNQRRSGRRIAKPAIASRFISDICNWRGSRWARRLPAGQGRRLDHMRDLMGRTNVHIA
jgi:hypothetical protein